MDAKLFLAVFGSVFSLKSADKTQMATLLFAADNGPPSSRCFASALALTATSALGVLAGGLLGQWLNPKYLGWFSGALFIAIGVWTILKAG
jgi:putative Ca2+/H+ antiporter (TMEM165/GDT1 family)